MSIKQSPVCPYCKSNNTAYKKNQSWISILTKVSLAFNLDQDVGPNLCFYYTLSKWDFLNDRISIAAASEFYFKHNLTESSEEEKLKLLIMSKNPWYYNPLKQPDNLEDRVQNYYKKYPIQE